MNRGRFGGADGRALRGRSSVRQIYETCVLRNEVLRGELREEEFAARLGWAINPSPSAPAVYTDPVLFFTRSYPTAALKTLLRDVLARLSGTDRNAPAIVRLETGFGGGKTHSLIALVYAASGRTPRRVLEPFGCADLVPDRPMRVAAVVGEDLNPASGQPHEGGITTWTPWGELAYQLGGPGAYRLVEAEDRARTVPGAEVWRRILGEEPALILLDELAPYLRALRTSPEYRFMAGSLAPFLKSLLEAVASSPRSVCVLTLAEASDAFGEETEEIAQALTRYVDELRSISARVERTLTPTHGEEEIGRILICRLLEQVDPDAAVEAATAYRAAYERWHATGVDLPGHVTGADYADLIRSLYPFHPEVLRVLNRKLATIDNFQRTRGALRLLARALRRVWEMRPEDAYLFHLHHFDLSDPDILRELTARLDRPRYQQVAEADIVGGGSGLPGHAEEIDRQWRDRGRPPTARRVATAIFLHSIVREGERGARPEEVNLAVLTPQDDPALLAEALRQLEDRCWHLDSEAGRWRFGPEPSINRMIADEARWVGVAQAKQEIDNRIRSLWTSGIFEVKHFPSEPEEVPDDAGRPKLVIVHYDAASARESDPAPPELVQRLYQYAGTAGGVRTFQNNVLFLVADAPLVPAMVEAARYARAIERLVGDPERLRHLSDEQRKRLRARRDAAELSVREAIQRCYRFLYYPSAEAGRESAYLAREVLPAQERAEVQQDQTRVLLEALRRLDKVWTAESDPIDPQYIKSRAWPAGRKAVAVSDVLRAFAMRRGLRILMDRRPLRMGITEGVRRGTWVYYDPREGVGCGPSSPTPLVDLEGDAELIEPEEARARGIRIKGEEERRCPVCGNLVEECQCAAPPPPPPAELRAEGVPDQALQAIIDQMHDRKISRIVRLALGVQGSDRSGLQELRSLSVAVPQLGPGTFRFEVRVTAEFGADEFLRMEFVGPWDRYRRLRDGLEAALGQATRQELGGRLEWIFEGEGGGREQLDTLREVLRGLNVGRVEVVAHPKEEG